MSKIYFSISEERSIEITVDMDDPKYEAETIQALKNTNHPEHYEVVGELMSGDIDCIHRDIQSDGWEIINSKIEP